MSYSVSNELNAKFSQPNAQVEVLAAGTDASWETVSERVTSEVEKVLEHRAPALTPQPAHPARSPLFTELSELKREMKIIFQQLDFFYRSLRLSLNRHEKAIQDRDGPRSCSW